MVISDGATAVTRLKQGLRSWLAERRLRGKIADISEQILDRALHDLGLTRPDLFTVSKRNPDHRNRMAKLLEHFGVDPERALPRYWGALRDAERICARCRNVKRCRAWLAWGLGKDAPRVFCPYAELFDEISAACRGEDRVSQAMEAKGCAARVRGPRAGADSHDLGLRQRDPQARIMNAAAHRVWLNTSR